MARAGGEKMAAPVVLVALGGNRAGRWGAPARALARAVRSLRALPGARVEAVSSLWRSAPVGVLAQPAFLNAVVLLRCSLPPARLLRLLRGLERAAGRLGGASWRARPLDLDLLAVGGRVARPAGMGRLGGARAVHAWQGRGIVLPHPALHARAFVLLPLVEVAPRWRHPLLGARAEELLARLPARVRASCRPLRQGDWPALLAGPGAWSSRRPRASQGRVAD